MRRRSLQMAAAVLLACCLNGERGAAEVHLSGTRDHVTVQATDATLPEILSALQAEFELKVTLRGTDPRKFSGSYSGTVRQVLSRILSGEDYVLETTADGFNVVVLSQSAADNAARPGLPAPPPPPAQNAGPPAPGRRPVPPPQPQPPPPPQRPPPAPPAAR